MTKLFTMIDGKRAFGDVIQPRKAHRDYTVVDPHELVEDLQAEGFRCTAMTQPMRRGDHRQLSDGGRWVLGFEYPDRPTINVGPGEDYRLGCRVLLDHTGLRSNRLAPGVLRIACENVFFVGDYALHHCREENAEFGLNPARFLYAVRDIAAQTPGRIELSRGFNAIPTLTWLRETHPRLYGNARRGLRREYRNEALSGWGLLQSLTWGCRKGGEKLSRYLLTDGWEAFAAGERPELESLAKWSPTLALLN